MKEKDQLPAMSSSARFSLDTKSFRMMLLMEIPFKHHGFIIGVGGKNVRPVMDETHTSVHFPDMNRNSSVKDPNQVIICGAWKGVEQARMALRYKAPFEIAFHLPKPMDLTAKLTHIKKKMNVEIEVHGRKGLSSPLCIVKAPQAESDDVIDASKELINVFDESSTYPVFIRWNASEEIKNADFGAIMDRTKTKIKLIELTKDNICYTDLKIAGTLDAVCQAREELLKFLKVTIIFNHLITDISLVTIKDLNQKFQVHISSIKNKDKSMSIMIAGAETNIANVYLARQVLLQILTKPKSLLIRKPIRKAYSSMIDLKTEEKKSTHYVDPFGKTGTIFRWSDVLKNNIDSTKVEPIVVQKSVARLEVVRPTQRVEPMVRPEGLKFAGPYLQPIARPSEFQHITRPNTSPGYRFQSSSSSDSSFSFNGSLAPGDERRESMTRQRSSSWRDNHEFFVNQSQSFQSLSFC